jgi:hypothetical protein
MQEQSAAAAAEEAQSIARMHEILESKDREIASLRDQLVHLKTDMVVLKEKSIAAKSWSNGNTTTTIIPTGQWCKIEGAVEGLISNLPFGCCLAGNLFVKIH